MGKILTAAAAIAALILVPVLAIAALFVVVISPVTAEEYRTTHCQGTLSGGALPATGGWRPPFEQQYRVTSDFGMRDHPVLPTRRLHAGVDLAAVPAGAVVVATAAGRVTQAGPSGGAQGNVVELAHDRGVATRYAHLAQVDVTVGDQVYSGQPMGVEGTSGLSQGIHLHFEVHLDGIPTDPVPWMAQRGAPLNGTPVAPSPPPGTGPDPDLPDDAEGGVGFDLPAPGEPRRASLVNDPVPVPADVQQLYEGAAREYNLPWALLAGIGMAETGHGANTATSTAGARGLMQFMPATFSAYGVDGDRDGGIDIDSDADSIYSAANYLTAMGVHDGEPGVRQALFAYNRATWYVNDVLHYAAAYGGGLVLAEPIDCPGGSGNPDLPPLDDERVRTMLEWAGSQEGKAYELGATGPDAWDCSSLTQAALATIGITTPRTAQAQRDWLAAGNGYQVPIDQAQPGDLFFYDSYLGPHTIGHVGLVWDPATFTSIEAANPQDGVGHFSYAPHLDNSIFEIWRVGSIADDADHTP
ncbi:peptidoglycan DD-metalloendopeptidase family protein [uncultured Serinicoccus sp.]|uniref:peptidoglycan DD-metalloendopeptidase family protein n=1 Tax=uncultured Serinicoccus sp. TaxID=735514 RepID=UPI0026313A8B|nr:peptidoglycan DD-metalloendopeptidase family protein [uncultured Serinicoccus sp.]